jgi:hypothetical protein
MELPAEVEGSTLPGRSSQLGYHGSSPRIVAWGHARQTYY